MLVESDGINHGRATLSNTRATDEATVSFDARDHAGITLVSKEIELKRVCSRPAAGKKERFSPPLLGNDICRFIERDELVVVGSRVRIGDSQRSRKFPKFPNAMIFRIPSPRCLEVSGEIAKFLEISTPRCSSIISREGRRVGETALDKAVDAS